MSCGGIKIMKYFEKEGKFRKLILRNDPKTHRLADARKALAKKRKSDNNISRAGVVYFENNKRFPGVLDDIPAYLRHRHPDKVIKLIAKKYPLAFSALETPAFIRKKIR